MERHYGWVIVAAGAVITCLAMGAMFALPVYLQPIADETGWTRAGISG
ncbi:MAG: MFS transporter, partial [Alphaproteobacteria bacterium]